MTESQDERLGLPSASTWRRYELCSGSYQLEGEARRLNQLAHETSPSAHRGTRIHAYLAGELDEDGEPIVLDEDEQHTADFLQERATGEVQRIFGDEASQTQLLNEKRLWLTIHGEKAASGQFDRVIYTPTVALCQDFKTGWREPDPAEQNAQLKVLAVLVALHLPSVKEVIVQIISGPYGVTEARYSIAKLAHSYNAILAMLKAIQATNAPLTPGVEQCRYCPAISCCPAVKALVPAMREVEALPDGDRGAQLLDEVEVLQKRLDAIREYYERRLAEDPAYDLPGYAMVPGALKRTVVDWVAARQRLAEWLDLAEVEGAANYRLGDLEKALGRKLRLKGKELKERMNTILQGLVEERPNAASLKRVKGEAAKVASLEAM